MKNLKKSEKNYKYLDLAGELKKLWNMKITIEPIVIGALGTIIKGNRAICLWFIIIIIILV